MKAVLIFSGYNQRAVIAFIRTLESLNVKYAIIARKHDDTIFLTDYKRNVIATRSKKELDIEDILDCVKDVKEKLCVDDCIIAPSTEALNRFLIINRSTLGEHNCNIPLVNETLYEKISDKYKFGDICKENDILTPQEYENLDNIILPCVAKPRKYIAADGNAYSPVLIYTQQELNKFKKLYHIKDFYFQEFVEGNSLYLLYYFYRGGSVVKLSQKNYIQQPNGKSVIAAASSDFHETDESTKYEKLFKMLEFSGLVMVEVKRKGDRNYMIEANPRFWGPSQLFVDAKVNFFEDLLFDYGFVGEKPQHRYPKEAIYFWYGGMIESIVSGGRLSYHSTSGREFADNLVTWVKADIYNRGDSMGIFLEETRL